MTYRLAVLGDKPTQLADTTLREWLKRAGFNVWSGWGPNNKEEDVWFGTVISSIPTGSPLLALGETAKSLTGYTLPVHKVRGSLLPYKEGWLVATLDPADVGISEGQDHLKPHLGGDARRALESLIPRIPKVSYLEGPQHLPGGPSSGTVVSVDIEGAHGRPNIVGVSWEEEIAYVFPWGKSLRAWLNDLFVSGVMALGYNMYYDLPELEEAGVKPPKIWYDAINMAALFDPSQPLNLQWQVLTHVPGSIAYKGLINHANGPDYVDAKVALYRRLWGDVLSRLSGPYPNTGFEWYCFYNGLDVCWTLSLFNNLKRKLEAQQ